MLNKNTIFIQIASYRDPELLNTLESCISNAEHPENLSFGIAWQHSKEDKWDTLDKYKENKQFRILDIPYKESKGVCWARNQVQQLYQKEKYTLQIDSHHRFIKNWDTVLIEMLENLRNKGYNKPLLTSYIPSYNPSNDPDERVNVPWWMTFDRFIPEGAIFFLPASIPNWEELTEPIPSRFYSAHFAFTVGEFCIEVQHDPNMYFHGEEISIAVRAFTHGYDLFHPHRVVAWHEYTRKGRKKQWDDDLKWGEKNRESHRRNRILFGMEEGCTPCMRNSIKPYDFGTERSLEDYERYSGIRFKDRAVQKYTLDNNFAPNPSLSDEEFENSFLTIFKHCIDVHKSNFDMNKDYSFWAVIFENDNGHLVNRIDLNKTQIKNYLSTNDDFIRIWREFQVDEKPYKWIVWPHSETEGWLSKIENTL